MSNNSSVFDQFTNLYSLSKTLRFELRPVGKTLENMREHLNYDAKLQTFLKDQEIEDAYQKLKPLFDSIHKEFITESLESETILKLDCSEYLRRYRVEEDLKPQESFLRGEIGKSYIKTGERWKKEKYKQYQWKVGGNVVDGAKILFSQDILQLIKDSNSDDGEINNLIDTFKRFFTYLSGFNQNRDNYYTTEEEKKTAVATRIVHENLPRFCDNLIQFEAIIKKKRDGIVERDDRKSEYLNIYNYLKSQNQNTQIKDIVSGELVEAEPITDELFDITIFSRFLTQKGIDEYNRKIGNYNLLINLYNQAREQEEKILGEPEKGFKRLPIFKTLYKQIGCGKRETFFYTLTHDTRNEAEIARENGKDANSVEELLELIIESGEQFFRQSNAETTINTVPKLLDYLLALDSYEGIYWSKAALNTISNKYFANFHELKDRLKEAKVFQKAPKGSEDDVKIPECIELASLFEVLENTKDWQAEGILFKESLTESLGKNDLSDKNRQRKVIIQTTSSPSKALLKLIFDDMQQHLNIFLETSDSIKRLKKYKSEESIEVIKAWMDHALVVNQMLKYFLVKENKIKGNPIDPILSEALKLFIASDEVQWFKWYDALRNYLTKKPQEDAKKNKLKLNFENGSLLNGFVDSHTKSDNATQYGGYFFRKWSNDLEGYSFFLGVSSNKKLFRCHLKNEVQKEDQSSLERLEYYQSKSTTFFSRQYSENKKRLLKYLFEAVKEQIGKFEPKVVENNSIKKVKSLIEKLENDTDKKREKSITPTQLIDAIQKSKQKELINIFGNEGFQLLVSETIKELKSHIKNYHDRVIKLREIESCSYSGTEGLKKIIDDLQTVAKEHKEYTYFQISQKEFEDACGDRKKPLYIFEIANKDLQKKIKTRKKEIGETGKNSMKNLHTLYFETMLAGNQATFDIGSGDIFYRKSGLDDKITKKGYNQKRWIIEGKRFTKNTELLENLDEGDREQQGKSFFLHLSIKLNYASVEGISKGKQNQKALDLVNSVTNGPLLRSSTLHFLGIDRGEKHLAFYCLINQKGVIVGQGSLNEPFIDQEGNPRSIKKLKYSYDKKSNKWIPKEVDCWDYNDLLSVMASNRDMARKNWKTIGAIEDLKAGYISKIVRTIADIATNEKRPAFIVLEDLNTGFKRGRQKIEKSVYQKFEIALAKKLNFLVDKTKNLGEAGSVTKALQLTPPINNYGDIENRKQVGIMLYTRANYTSQTDPATGWRKKIYLKSSNIKEQFVGDDKNKMRPAFTDIYFDGLDYVFVYTDDVTGKQWLLYSGFNGKSLDRFKGRRGEDKYEWINKPQDIVSMLDQLFLNFDKKKSLLDQLRYGTQLTKVDEHHSPWESLRFAVELIQQIRNTGETERDSDFILSPVRNENGQHFDSRVYWDQYQQELKKPSEERTTISMPISGDANGAYNIARKGLMMNEHIRQWKSSGEKNNDLNLLISENEWDLYLANPKNWKENLHRFSSWKEVKESRR